MIGVSRRDDLGPQAPFSVHGRIAGWQVSAAEILTKLDVVIGPEVVARLTLDQFEKGKAPEGGLLRAYSSGGENRVIQLMGAFAG